MLHQVVGITRLIQAVIAGVSTVNGFLRLFILSRWIAFLLGTISRNFASFLSCYSYRSNNSAWTKDPVPTWVGLFYGPVKIAYDGHPTESAKPPETLIQNPLSLRPRVVIDLRLFSLNLTGSGSSGNPYTLTAK